MAQKIHIDDILQSYFQQTPALEQAIVVNVADQQCLLIDRAGKVHKTYQVSTAAVGINNAAGSNGTPVGLHSVCELIGDTQPLGRRFIGRVANDEIIDIVKETPNIAPTGDYILTRILRLKGEEQINNSEGVDSFKRYVYFHGTNEEYLIGTPASHGCIRMRNDDIVEIFGLVALDTPVIIS